VNEPFITIDLHGMKQDQAIRVIDRALIHSEGVYQVRLIHGYHSGDNLKTMIGYRYRNHPKVKRIKQGDNPGITVLILKELY
jgi:DNA-nicking Smr family endonuclease